MRLIRSSNAFAGAEKGIAFVNYMTVETARHALDFVLSQPVCGLLLTANFAKHTPTPASPTGKFGNNETPSNVLWIQDIPEMLTERGLQVVLAPFPGLLSVSLVQEKTVGAAHFRTMSHAAKARNCIKGKALAGQAVKVTFGKHNIPLVCLVPHTFRC
eukprot:TRINITY_DN16682_c0_g1_i3.p2 TRINITY_DN16682_c0_g1~~TRINITY_DN16682_c0_g1_i3.p2  ORF type:complete len:158 (+),score=40.52 TRINITY_DN16682_c0_g1_i3:49-522(+)